jgi:LytS/YehU family sensor histidine kinase
MKTVLLLLVAFFPVFLLGFLFTNHEESGVTISAFNSFFQLLITLPVTWVLYRQFLKRNTEITSLKQELGQSHASFDFLRSQINPHFLFNALNTIYGTALQEGAERTSEGIERLSDMMRFMLQENMQKTISLSREVDYLNNYVVLQKLRTDAQPLIKLEVEIEQHPYNIQIAPMLLIPFVENAFKHGISFRESSYISVHLDVKDNTLYFDVSNSKHPKPENDPEKNKSGIGLVNVRQRLQLLYPQKHELVIRETKKDFFVHLTLQLS